MKDEEESLSLRSVLMQQFKNSRNLQKKFQQPVTAMSTEEQTVKLRNLKNEKEKKNNCTKSSDDNFWINFGDFI